MSENINEDNIEIEPTLYDTHENKDSIVDVIERMIRKIDESTEQAERLAFAYEARDFTNEYYEERFLKGENSK